MAATSLDSAQATLRDAQQDTPDWAAVNAAAQTLADQLGGDEGLRPTLGSPGLLETTAKLLNDASATPAARLQLCRLVGNACVGDQGALVLLDPLGWSLTLAQTIIGDAASMQMSPRASLGRSGRRATRSRSKQPSVPP
jgi:hypothetical protein